MEKEQYIDVKNYIREKSGLYYAVMVYTNVKGERKEKWFPTKLSVKGNKTRAEALDESQPIESQILSAILDKITLSELSTEQVSNLLFADYMKIYLLLIKKRKKRIQWVTYADNVKFSIEPYFRKKKIRLRDLSEQDIKENDIAF